MYQIFCFYCISNNQFSEKRQIFLIGTFGAIFGHFASETLEF